MNKKDIMIKFLNNIEIKKLMTLFISNIFDYENFHEYNYLYRLNNEVDRVVIDIYDNVSDNRFNRYVFYYNETDFDVKVFKDNNVFVTYINVLNVKDSDIKLYKLAYLFSLDDDSMIIYAKTFLDDKFVQILDKIIK